VTFTSPPPPREYCSHDHTHTHTEDELQNVEMVEEERRRKNEEVKKKKKDYTGYDDDEFVSGKEGMKRAVLAKYDEEIEGSSEIVRFSLVSVERVLNVFVVFCRDFVWEAQRSLRETFEPKRNRKLLP
jgi:hypothetical protein